MHFELGATDVVDFWMYRKEKNNLEKMKIMGDEGMK